MFYFNKRESIHFFDRFAIYWHPYLQTVDSEYWHGFDRKKIGTMGRFTFWIRENSRKSINQRGEK